jgi:two-component system, LuxR family, sensor kinase FixL
LKPPRNGLALNGNNHDHFAVVTIGEHTDGTSHSSLRAKPGEVGRLRWFVAMVLAASIFWVGSSTQLVGAVSILYMIVLVIVGGSMRRTTILSWSAACALLTIISFLINDGIRHDPLALPRVAASLAANVITTMLLLRSQKAFIGLKDSEYRYRTIFDTLALAIWEHDFSPVENALATLRANGVTDLAGYLDEHPEFVREARKMVRIIDVNETAVRLMGVPSKAHFFTSLSGFLPESDESFVDCLLAIDERRETFQAETVVIPMDGQPLHVIVTFSLSSCGPLKRVPACILNITERRRLEATIVKTRSELERAQRAEMLGAITATIAHEINQPLTAIQSFADAASRWIQRKEPDLEQIQESLSGLSESVAHARDVIRRTRSLVGTSDPDTNPVDLNELIADVALIMRTEAAVHQVRIATESDGEVSWTMGDPVLLRQVLVNLITNAIQAMTDIPPANRLVRLLVRTEQEFVTLRVIDAGPGWGEGAEDKLLSPFTTSKAEGMGLGLSICRSIIEAHKGTIRLRPAATGGAEVEIVLQARAVEMAVG